MKGSNILSTLLSLPKFQNVYSLGRREPKATSATLRPIIEADTSKWPSTLSSTSPTPSIFISALGTTRAQAGGVDKQRLIDYDLNLDMAKAAKAAGVKVYVLISSAGASKDSRMPYPKMKGELEEAVKGLDFEKTVILKPGLIVGTREDARAPEAVFRGIAKGLGAISGGWLKDGWAQDADVIAKAAVNAGLKALDGETTEKVVEITQAGVVKLGRTEWKA
jgi:hypothetical protein